MSQHGGNIYSFDKEIIDFSANINPFGISERVKNVIIKNLDKLVNYPDTEYRKLKNAISQFHNINTNSIVCGNGGADIIYRLVHALKPCRAIVQSPTFSEYEKALSEVNCKVINYNSLEIKENILGFIDGSIDFIVICNPNNPTGTITEKTLLKKIALKSLQCGAVLLLDECFNDYKPLQYSMIDEINDFPNIFILKSMTKMYASAGLRLGYGISSNCELIKKVSESGQPWAINILSAEAGIEMLKDIEYRENFINFVLEESEFLYKNLNDLGFEVFKPNANYVFFYSKNTELHLELLKNGILIRDCSNYKNLGKGYYRIAVKQHEDNLYLINLLERYNHLS